MAANGIGGKSMLSGPVFRYTAGQRALVLRVGLNTVTCARDSGKALIYLVIAITSQLNDYAISDGCASSRTWNETPNSVQMARPSAHWRQQPAAILDARCWSTPRG